ncbi:hypothetical protein MPSEU_000848000 [Mayamaea pseudoterrestris]|nr:hypothetical protein MPSEU_000848000 [Mayamaea pseudoterrestris]
MKESDSLDELTPADDVASLQASSPIPTLDHSPSESPAEMNNNIASEPLKLLTALHKNDIVALRIMVDNQIFASPPGFAPQDSFIGHDGNKFYCQVCKQLGEIVCCDGCPRAYHLRCLPLEGESHLSLLRDDDPWFCPVCWELKVATPADENSVNHEETDRHSPEEQANKNLQMGSHLLDHETNSEEGQVNDSLKEHHKPVNPTDQVTNPARKRRARATSPKPALTADTDYDSNEQDNIKQKVKKRERNGDRPVRKQRRVTDSRSENPDQSEVIAALAPLAVPASPSMDRRVPADPLMAALGNRTHAQGLVQATPAFYFFLSENRWKIERALTKSHRYFNRLSKGNLERNALVAKEAAVWFSKLRPFECRRYVNMSMNEFEHRIIQWKEDKNVQAMADDDAAEDFMTEPQSMADTEEDLKLQNALHKRLYDKVSVGHKEVEMESDVFYNKVLIAALHDVRFHASDPLFAVNRLEIIEGQGATKGAASMHGPVATSVGDECYGCTRGWLHYCPVVQRRLPAVKRRAKVQPGLSSLLATRVGLGLRPRLQHDNSPEIRDGEMMEWRPTMQQKILDNLLPSPSCSLTNPSARADDIARFVEGALALSNFMPTALTGESEASDTTSAFSSESMESGSVHLYECGSCHCITRLDAGCLKCLKAQFVDFSARRRNSERHENLVVHSTMLNRVHSKEKTVELSEGDRTIAKKLAKREFLPIAILPSRPVAAPRPKVDAAILRDEDESGASTSDVKHEPEKHVVSRHSKVLENPADQSSADFISIETVGEMGSNLSNLDKMITVNETKSLLDSGGWSKRITFIACAGIFVAILRRDPFRSLNELSKLTVPENADDSVSQPKGLTMIRSRLLRNEYVDVRSFVEQIRLLCHDARSIYPVGSLQTETADLIFTLLSEMATKAEEWVQAITVALSADTFNNSAEHTATSIALTMRRLEKWLKNQIETGCVRMFENEVALYGALAVRRAAKAAEASIAPYPRSLNPFSAIPFRSFIDDDALCEHIDQQVAVVHCVRPHDITSPREESIIRLLHCVRARRLNLRTALLSSGCARCNSLQEQLDILKASAREIAKAKRDENILKRIDGSRLFLSTGTGSDKTCRQMAKKDKDLMGGAGIKQEIVSVRKSKIHGVGLFADKAYETGEIVCEIVGEYCNALLAEAKQKKNLHFGQQCFQFRIEKNYVLDATRKGRISRFINHSCTPNCITKVVHGMEPGVHKTRVFVMARTSIAMGDEITYDYRLPVERDLSKRIPCRCQSATCRGFINWQCPEGECILSCGNIVS